MASKKNQHFLPQYFFKYFSSNKKTINLILRKTGKIINNASIKGQCSKNNFYGEEKIENLFSKIEGEHGRILRRVLALKSFQDFKNYVNDYDPDIQNDIEINPDILTLLQVVLFQRSRTEYEAKKSNESFAKMYKEIFLSHLEAKEEVELLQYKEKFDISINETASVLMLVELAFESTPAILDMGIYILKNKTDTEYIFSDSPVVLYNKAYKDIKGHGVLGLQSPGLLVFFPISPDTCLLLVDEQKYQGELLGNHYFHVTNKFDIDNINKLQLHHSLNAIYFSDNLPEKYIKKIWRQQKSSFVDLLGKFHQADSFDEYGNKTGELLHMYEEQIPFEMGLSFMKAIDLSEEIIIPNYRNKELIDIIKKSKDEL